MPYASVSEVPDYVPEAKRAQWKEVWNSAYKRAIDDGKSKKKAEESAFAQANAVAGPNSKEKAMPSEFKKFVRLTKVDETTHTVLGIVTSEVLDKDDEIADYEASKKAFQVWSNDFITKTTAAGQDPSLGNIRLMHGLEIAGKATKIDFRDSEKQIWLETTPVDDRVWKLIKGGFITGYSMGGAYAWTKPEGNGRRFGPEIAEVSYVDNPCNPDASFAYVKNDKSVEMRKFANPATASDDLRELLQKKEEHAAVHTGEAVLTPAQVESLKKDLLEEIRKSLQKEPASIYHSCEFCEDVLEKDGKTKRKGGKDLHASDFAYVGDPDDISTWKLPIHDAAHARNALARFDQTQGIPADKKAKVRARIVAAAKKFGIEVSETAKKALAQVEGRLRKVFDGGFPKDTSEEVKKSMWEVSRFAQMLQDLEWLCLDVEMEEEREGDDSEHPSEMKQLKEDMAALFLSYTEEQIQELTARKGALGGTMTEDALKKAAKTIAEHLDGLHKAHADHCEKMTKLHTEHAEKMHKLHKDHMEMAHGVIAKMHKALKDGYDGEGDGDKDDEAKKAAAAAKKQIEDDEAAKKAAAAAGSDSLVKLIESLSKSVDSLSTKMDDQAKKFEAEVAELKKAAVAPTQIKQTLIGRDGKELSKASGNGVMEDTGL